MSALAWLVGLLLFASAAYYALAILAGRKFVRFRRPAHPSHRPPLSILKPVRGPEPGFYDAIRSHALQDYPDFELLFAVSDPNDPVVADIRRLAVEFPQRRIELFVADDAVPAAGKDLPNPKVRCLARLEREARNGLLLITDSDISLAPGDFGRLAAPLADPKVALATSLYRARPAGGLPSLLEALWSSAEFQAQVLSAWRLEGLTFALGASMLVRRSALEEIGGFDVLQPFLADDYQLGNRVVARGHKVVLADTVVETQLSACRWEEVWRHLLRWSRTIRVCRPASHAGLILTQATVWSLAAFAAAPAAPVLAAAGGACLALRLFAGWVIGWQVTKSETVHRSWWLLPVADLLGAAVWAASWLGNQIEWRGSKMRLTRDGRLRARELAGASPTPSSGSRNLLLGRPKPPQSGPGRHA